MPYSKAHIVLDAVQYATKADLKPFRELVSSNASTLQSELVLRILLTFLPESTEPSAYIQLLRDLSSGLISKDEGIPTAPQLTKDINVDEAKRQVRQLRLLRLEHASIASEVSDPLERFLFCRAYRIDSEIGSLELIEELIRPFTKQYNRLSVWAISTILPLQRLEQQDSDLSPTLSLSSLGPMNSKIGLETILDSDKVVKGKDHSGRLRNILGPWIYGDITRAESSSRSLSSPDSSSTNYTIQHWNNVNEWFLNLAKKDYESAVKTYVNWNGPRDVDYGSWETPSSSQNDHALESAYQQLGLALAYISPGTGSERQIGPLLRVIAQRAKIELNEELTVEACTKRQSRIGHSFLASISNIHLAPNELLDNANPLTKPSKDSLAFAQFSLVSSEVLSRFEVDLTLQKCVYLALFEPASNQRSSCSRVIRNLPSISGKDDAAWMSAIEKLLWLHDWKTDAQPGTTRQGLFSQVDVEQSHFAILESLVTNGRYKLAMASYCSPVSKLSISRVKDALINVVLASYDNASNGNKTRGGIKKAADIITTFQSKFPGFQRMSAMWALIQATHRLSFYSLTLQHGVPLLPVNIRIHPEPLTLIDKVLQQNPGSYTKLDDMLDIGRELVKAGRITFPSQKNAPVSEDEAILQVEQSITAKAISASLSEDDFDTAYSYIVNRLAGMSSSDLSSNDHLWRAAYQAGRYSSESKSSTSPSALRRLEQRMELLSQALLLAPTSSLQEVLATWRECEKNLNSAIALESREEDAWQAKGDRILPGGFSHDEIAPVATKAREHTRRAMDEEAPMGLFDVARGAAAALSKSAFPLRAQASRTSGETARSDDDAPQRVRKRDMVSNMVTGGLASGIGWVIGAQPVEHNN